MTTNEGSTEEEAKGGDDGQNNDFISLSRFELLKWILKIVCSPLLIYFYYFMMSMWPWISLERESCYIWSLRTISIQCHNNPVFVPLCKPPDHVKDIYEVHTFDLKTRVGIWTKMDVVPVEYGKFAQKSQLTMWFFQFITRIVFKWDYVIGRSFYLLV